MGRAPCCSKVGLQRGPWSTSEDKILVDYIHQHGEGQWRSLPNKAGLLRCGKSCRLRWMNYLRPDIKRGNITPDEEDLIIRMHSLLGNRWSLIAKRLLGRTDNEIKNYWNSHLSKRLRNINDSSAGTSTKPRLSCNKAAGDPKKRNNGTHDAAPHEMKVKVEVHQPKAVRVFPCSVSRIDTKNRQDVQVSILKDDGNPYEDYYCNIMEESDRPGSPYNLEKIYEEYQQLLKEDDDNDVQLESFADSLLM
ncbi:hypothetical protein SAY87_031981 [Trapa incisa]|uniref:Uncharacterized protein n=1 Tax=Trapa incisa TaxID=236973 RepID=A0AAN7KU92_9MYRT|nr:hypothetical protein SAY87_031981 [Trapa incisa]